VPGRNETQYVTRGVHEHRAPTDESVKLLTELEKAADKRRIKTLELSNNLFSGKLMIEYQHYSGDTVARCVFDLNGKRITVDAQSYLGAGGDRMKLLLDLRDKVAARIASEMLTQFASGTLTDWPRRETGSVRSMSGPVAESETPK
jgi:hypothetical protein